MSLRPLKREERRERGGGRAPEVSGERGSRSAGSRGHLPGAEEGGKRAVGPERRRGGGGGHRGGLEIGDAGEANRCRGSAVKPWM